MPSYLTVLVLGHVGQDPELRYTPSGVAVANFSVAVDKGYFDKENNWIEKTRWFKITCWRELAERVKERIQKGDLVFVVGDDVTAGGWEGKDGTIQTSLDVTASKVIGLTKHEDQDDPFSPSAGAGSGSARRRDREPSEAPDW